VITARFDARDLTDAWTAALEDLAARDVVRRLWEGDHTAVADDPTEVADRLGWLTVLPDSERCWADWAGVADAVADEVDHVVVLGMGGSSLFPEVLTSTFEGGDGFPELRVLDTTDPAAVRRTDAECPAERTLFVVSSKSGSTIETRSHLDHFWARRPDGAHFVTVTDPGSALEALATGRGFRHIAHGVPEIGGRYSALSAFGLLPAALMGIEGLALLETAEEAAEALGPDTPVTEHVAAQLGALMAVAALAGRDKLTFLIDDRLETFGLWVEQLIAESTGKHGVGILPVVGERATDPDPEHRLYVVIGEVEGTADLPGPSVRLAVEEPEDLGAQVFCWEFATALAGVVLGINPFDQPDVESAKQAARAVLTGDGPATAGEHPTVGVDDALALVRPGDAIVLAAFCDPALEAALQRSRRVLGDRAGVATTLGLGPRFLHSTGQLHKGGPDRIVVVQAVADVAPGDDVEVPGAGFTFGRLERAQADGDLTALATAGKRAVRVRFEDLLELS
jgi:glucose-6-phosphate isomerase